MQGHTTPFSEPIGIIAGIVGGRIGSFIGREIAQGTIIPPPAAAFAGGAVGHYCASVVTKSIINVLGLDAGGLVAGAVVTSPVTALIDGICSATHEAFPGIANPDELREIVDNAMTEPDATRAAKEIGENLKQKDQVHFGGLAHAEMLAGQQVGPECGIHALGNLAQFNNPGFGEGVNSLIKEIEASDGGLVSTGSGYALDIRHYEHILEQYFNTPVHWEVFDMDRINNFLSRGHAILVVGDAHFLDPSVYPPESLHAFNVVDLGYDSHGKPWFFGLDSNCPNTVKRWPATDVLQAAAHAPYDTNALITDRPVKWPFRT